MSKSRPYITNYLRLLSLPSSIKVMVNQKIISVGHARCLINAKNPEKLVQTVIAKKLSVRETEKLVANEAKDENGAKNTNSQPQYISSLQKDISNYLNRDVVIKQDSKGRGYIKVKFLSIEDVHRWFNIKEGK